MASVELLAGPERRRRWSFEQKQAIVAAAFGPGAVVRDVARQADGFHSVSTAGRAIWPV
jgi:transposase